jgi:hypothetical protein
MKMIGHRQGNAHGQFALVFGITHRFLDSSPDIRQCKRIPLSVPAANRDEKQFLLQGIRRTIRHFMVQFLSPDIHGLIMRIPRRWRKVGWLVEPALP